MQVNSRAATTPNDLSQSYVLDLNAVESLKTSAKQDPKNAIKQVAGQFEAMFLSTAHTDEVIDETLEAMRGALGDL